ncbi:MAG: beta-ketoacyl-ACP synthase [Alphaproteobacteria bacterium]|nr:beta-ketoacyl-ACP synthase [Alphaproteobacteria bacterium]
MKRVVVTGMGVVSALGNSLESSWERLHTFQNAVQKMQDLEKYKGLHALLGAPDTDFTIPDHFTRKTLRTMGPVSVMAVYSAEEAIKQAGLKDQNDILTGGRTGVAYGSSWGSAEPICDFFDMLIKNEVTSVTSSTYVKMMPQTTAVNLSLYFKTTGRLIPSGTACTSGSLAIGYAYETIRQGLQDVMIVGGAEEFSPTQVAVFDTLFATSTKNDKPAETPSPFDANRDGLVIGEGAGTLILEEYEHAKARGTKIYAELVGFGTNTDGTHITQPNFETMAICMKLALESAGLSASNIGYINAHGTGTHHGDIAESRATEQIFGTHTPISSLKSYVGHTLGACGSLEAIWSIQMMNNNWFAPTLNLKHPDENCGKLDYIMNEARKIDTSYIMSNNFAFGGINTSLIFKRVTD